MNTSSITVVRVYITEGDKLLNTILDYLHNDLKVKGVTVFRAISGFGQSGVMHSDTLLSMSLNLPLIIEFFDIPDQIALALPHIRSLVGSGHIVSWPANLS